MGLGGGEAWGLAGIQPTKVLRGGFEFRPHVYL